MSNSKDQENKGGLLDDDLQYHVQLKKVTSLISLLCQATLEGLNSSQNISTPQL